MPHALRIAGLTVAALTVSLLAPTGVTTGSAAGSVPAAAEEVQQRPNIVVVQLDDVSRNLMRTMSQVDRMRSEGTTFTNSFVVDSLCCPSRASFFTGRAPHHTGVRTNSAGDRRTPTGGWEAYLARKNPAITFHRRMRQDDGRRRGYVTGFVGKFLNGYSSGVGERYGAVPGWDEFAPVYASGYRGWDFSWGKQQGGELRTTKVRKPDASASDAVKDRKYVQSFMERKALDFIDRHEPGARPYLYVLSTYAAHSRVKNKAYAEDPPFPPAYRDRPGGTKPDGNCGDTVDCDSLDVRDEDAWNDPPADNRPQRVVDGRVVDANPWRPDEQPDSLASLNNKYRQRAQMLQSVDRTLEKILDRVGEDTYVVLTSDNGYHLGEYSLGGGKGTPYDTDTRVPLYVVGPGVPADATRSQQVTNLDLAPTFERLAGIGERDAPYRDGVSFAPLLRAGGAGAAGGRFTFFEHTRDSREKGDPDGEAEGDEQLTRIPSYVGVRSSRGLLVRLDLAASPKRARYAWELYDYENGYEDTNVFRELRGEGWVRTLREKIKAWSTCKPRRCARLTRSRP